MKHILRIIPFEAYKPHNEMITCKKLKFYTLYFMALPTMMYVVMVMDSHPHYICRYTYYD